MEIINKRVDELIPYINNSRTHDTSQILQIAASIKEFGFTNPVIIDGDNGIIAGHGRLMGAKKLGLSEVPCIELSHLSESQKKAYIIADNQLALNAGWDMELLKIELDDLGDMDFDIDLLGFDDEFLDDILNDGSDFDAGNEDDQGQLDELDPKYIDCPNCGKEFDMRKV
jgi:ParB-like chromosome segregation protein Spo0J